MNKNQRNYLIGLFSTLVLFGVFVYFFLEPKYGPQVRVLEKQDEKGGKDKTSDDINTDLLDYKAPEGNLNPDYGELTEEQISITDKAIGNLLNSSEGITPPMVSIKSFEEQEFSDASLGCGQPEQMYAQVATPGYKIVLEAQGKQYDYRIAKDSEEVILCE